MKRRPAHKIDDHGAYLPSEEEIAEACRRIREEGYVDSLNRWHPPWDDHEYVKRSGSLAGDVVAPVVSGKEMGMER